MIVRHLTSSPGHMRSGLWLAAVLTAAWATASAACRPTDDPQTPPPDAPGASQSSTAGGDSLAPPAAPGTAGAGTPNVDLAQLTSVRIDGVPHIRQKPDFCGEAVTAMYLEALGKGFDQDDVFGLSGMDPARGMGATTKELKTALERIGFEVGPVWHTVAAAGAERGLEAQFAALHADLRRNVPSIVCMHYDDQPKTTEHFRLVLGYDAESGEVIYHEPAEDQGAYRRMSREAFLRRWPLKYRADRWTVIRFRLKPGTLTKPPQPAGRHSRADLAQHVMRLKAGLPGGFTIVVEPPFVVAGDESPEVVRQRAASTVRWAVQRLKRDYFKQDPKHILDVFLFRDDRSYRHHARAFFGDDPNTPYGYYTDRHRALVMNIATGGGTLVHEIVHPFMDANFPNCPAWFNEGMGSLYEQSANRDGHIVGLTNWRLAGLQQAISARRVPSFRTLTATTSHQFYEEDPGTNYAQARYLLYYLQEKGLLVRYYHRFLRSRRQDPTGYATLKTLLGERDMTAFQKRWEAYVLALSFP